MILKYTGKYGEVVDVLGGIAVIPQERLSVRNSLAPKLLATKRWKKDAPNIKEKKNNDS